MSDETRGKLRRTTTVGELRLAVAAARSEGKSVGLVPTMGALHQGHLSLVEASVAQCGFTVVTIFVNPAQFGPDEDLARYPCTLEADLDALARCGADVAFVPAAEEIYPAGHATGVELGGVAEPLEGQHRAGHFAGVATVVLKLFNMAGADVAYFGRKDYQQMQVVKQMVADLNVPITICECPTVREPDGLAMSSRNKYLAGDARQRALVLWKSLCLARRAVAQGQRDGETILRQMREVIRSAEGAVIDYAALVDPETLAGVARVEQPTLAVLAVKIDETRLIDNCLLEPPLE
ncbi:MAG: pantoate--beta-alanine ligase [Planctomycetes bacterium]|nr:pantoate--beta-alanine ligase [Planctomycetota bacterium]